MMLFFYFQHISGISNYYWAIIAVIAASIALQLVCIILSVVLLTHRYPNTKRVTPIEVVEMGAVNANFKSSDLSILHEHGVPEPETPQDMKQMNDALTAMTFIVAALHIVRNVLQGDIPGAFDPTPAPTEAAGSF